MSCGGCDRLLLLLLLLLLLVLELMVGFRQLPATGTARRVVVSRLYGVMVNSRQSPRDAWKRSPRNSNSAVTRSRASGATARRGAIPSASCGGAALAPPAGK